MASYSKQKERPHALFEGYSMTSYSCSTLRLPSFDSDVFTKKDVVTVKVNNSKILYTDKVESCRAVLSG